MTLEKHLAEPLDEELSPNIPDPEVGVVKRWHVEGLEVRLLKNAAPISDKSIVALPWAMVVLFEGKLLYAVTVEKEDLRILSSFTGEAVKELQADYGVRGFFTEPHAVMYGDGLREDLGPYGVGCSEEDIRNYLMEAVLDSFDLIEDPVEF